MTAITFDRPRLPALTTVRFFAALWVALFHMQAMNSFHFGTAALRQFASIGYCGVSFFFVLSGFILVYTYAGRATTVRDFWQARFARIYPALAFCLLITAPFFIIGCLMMRDHYAQFYVREWAPWIAPHLWLSAILSVTLTEAWIPQAALAWNMPNWSLSVEAFFYLLFPFMLPRMMRLSRRQLLAIAPVGWLFGIGCTLAYLRFHPDGAVVDPTTIGPWINAVKFHPLIRLPEFLMGMAAGLLFLRSERNRRMAWPLVLTGMASIAAVAALSPRIPYLVIHTSLLAPAFAVLVYGVALRPAGVEVLEHKVMEALGEASYPFYLLHSMVISMFFNDWKAGTTKHQTLLGFLTWLLIAVAIAVLVDRLIERPLRRLLRPKKKPVEAAPLPAPA
ncbi:MAG: acyltransferase [Terracidiphilus sp.]|jgi:peptidoglycan/LPS O-acetylase OafA/YrhL